VSDDEGQFGERVGKSSARRNVDSEIVEASAEVLDEGMAGDDDPGGTVSLQSWRGSKPGLEASVVGLQRVVRMDLRVVEAARSRSSMMRRYARYRSVVTSTGEIRDRSLEEASGCHGVPAT
jgi:hypothetical protein